MLGHGHGRETDYGENSTRAGRGRAAGRRSGVLGGLAASVLARSCWRRGYGKGRGKGVGSWRARSLGAGRLVVRRVGEARRQGEKEGRGGAYAQKRAKMSLAAAADQGRAAG